MLIEVEGFLKHSRANALKLMLTELQLASANGVFRQCHSQMDCGLDQQVGVKTVLSELCFTKQLLRQSTQSEFCYC